MLARSEQRACVAAISLCAKKHPQSDRILVGLGAYMNYDRWCELCNRSERVFRAFWSGFARLWDWDMTGTGTAHQGPFLGFLCGV